MKNSHRIQFCAAAPCTTPMQEQWARTVMEAMHRIEYGDDSEDDVSYVENELELDYDDVVLVPDFDLHDDKFRLFSTEIADDALAAQIFSAYLANFYPKHTMMMSVAHGIHERRIPDAPTVGSIYGYTYLITADDVEVVDPNVQVLKKIEAKRTSKLKGFGSYTSAEEKRSVWWYVLVGTAPKRMNFKKPVTQERAMRTLQEQLTAKGWKKTLKNQDVIFTQERPS